MRHVLLIEDEPNIVEALSFIFLRDGWKVDAHSDGTYHGPTGSPVAVCVPSTLNRTAD